MFRIGDFSKLGRTTIKTLRFYDEEGLLKPKEVDRWTGYRYYSTEQLFLLQKITAFRQAGLSILEIREILNGASADDKIELRREAVEQEMKDATERFERICFLQKEYKENQIMEYQAIIKTLPACTVYYQIGCIHNFSQISEFILNSGEECRKANPKLECVQPDYCYVSYLDGEYKERDIRIEYAQAVTKAGNETENIHFKQLKETQAACVYHKGPYTTLSRAYAFLMDWIDKNGYKIVEYPRESYIDGVWNKKDEKDWLTEIQVPVIKK